MEDIQLLEAVERYIRGEMKTDERVHFEQLRKTNPEVDQLVVEHTLFIHQMNEVGELRKFKSTLNEVHTDLAEKGLISSDRLAVCDCAEFVPKREALKIIADTKTGRNLFWTSRILS